MKNTEQEFLKEPDNKLWKAADRLRSNLDAANYKHIVLGLIFLKYVSDAFEERQQELVAQFKNEDDDYYLPAGHYDSPPTTRPPSRKKQPRGQVEHYQDTHSNSAQQSYLCRFRCSSARFVSALKRFSGGYREMRRI